MSTVRKKWQNITVICVIHDVSEAMQFDQVAVFEDGKIVEQGKPEELMANDGALKRLLEHESSVASVWLDNDKWRRVSVDKGRIKETHR
jgi:ABC-type multidrug transport system fused ATPase/permease subunit